MTLFKNKPLAALLAAVTGSLGLQHAYLGRRWLGVPLWLFTACASLMLAGTALSHKSWYTHWAFFVLGLFLAAGFIEALVIALMPDEKWDVRYNTAAIAAGHAPSNNRWAPVLIAIFTLLIGATIVMTIIILMIQTILELNVTPLG